MLLNLFSLKKLVRLLHFENSRVEKFSPYNDNASELTFKENGRL